MLALIVSALGSGLGKALEKLLEKGVIEPALDKGLEPLRAWLTRGYDQKQDEAKLRRAIEAALKAATGTGDMEQWTKYRWVVALDQIQAKPELAAQVSAAAVEMAREEPSHVPPDLLKALKLTDDQRPALATFLFALRKGLSNLEPYAAGIRYADTLDDRHMLDGLYDRVSAIADTVTDTTHGKALRVQIVPPDTREVERPYLDNLLIEYAALSLESRTREEAVPSVDLLRLERVYIALNTTEVRFVRVSEEEQKERGRGGPTGVELKPVSLSALRVVMEARRMVLLGDPGSGKSTFAQHLCLCLAGARRNPNSQWSNHLRAGDVEAWEVDVHPLPLFIRLRLFAHDMDSLPDDPDKLGRAEHLVAYAQKEFARLGRNGLEAHLLDALENRQTLVVLDGLDEVTNSNPARTDAERRRQVAQAIQDFARRYPYSRLIVTCREKQYPRDAKGRPTAEWKLTAFSHTVIADFDPAQVKEFVVHWFAEQDARRRLPDAGDKRDSLLAALASRPELAQLAPKPILLTQMALVHTHKKLPDSRVEVYRECADLLLWEWERLRARQAGRQGQAAPDFLQTLIPGLRQDEVEDALDRAVFQAHAAGDPEIPAERILRALRDLFRDVYALAPDQAMGRAEKFILDWLNSRSGLLVPAAEDTFTVPHPSFREFMAARFLRENRLPHPDDEVVEEDWKLSGPRLVRENYDRWREVFRFAAGLDSPAEVASALNELCPEALTYAPAEVRLLLLAGEVARDVGGRMLSTRSRVGRQVVERLEYQLIHLMRDTDSTDAYPKDRPRLTAPDRLTPKTRLAAGEFLSDLGWTPPDLDDLVPVELPDDRRFWMGKYPVTNLQYARFLAAPDYADETLWRSLTIYDHKEQQRLSIGEVAWKWFQDAGGPERRPGYWAEARFGAARRLFPVVGVTWYEAAAYAAWLNGPGRAHIATPIPVAVEIRLPLESEWTLTAGGEQGDRYPWQATPQLVEADAIPGYANTTESDLNGTTPVCQYPAGMSLAQVMDMAGNVWEWQANWSDKDQDFVALRGGAGPHHLDAARVAARYHNHPRRGWDYNGFRVAGAVPVSL